MRFLVVLCSLIAATAARSVHHDFKRASLQKYIPVKPDLKQDPAYVKKIRLAVACLDETATDVWTSGTHMQTLLEYANPQWSVFGPNYVRGLVLETYQR